MTDEELAQTLERLSDGLNIFGRDESDVLLLAAQRIRDLSRDRERLDYLDQPGMNLIWTDFEDGWAIEIDDEGMRVVVPHHPGPLRAAIDAAREEEKS